MLSLILLTLIGSAAPQLFFRSRYDLTETVTSHDVGYQVKGMLHVRYRSQNLIQVEASSLKFSIKSKKGLNEHKSKFDASANDPFLVEIDQGRVLGVYVASTEKPFMVNIKRGLASLFQLQNENTLNESDVSGDCAVRYRVDKKTVTKDKTCGRDKPLKNGVWGRNLESKRTTEAQIDSKSTVESLKAFETHTMRVGLGGPSSLEVKSEILLKSTELSKEEMLVTMDVAGVVSYVSSELGIEFQRYDLTDFKPVATPHTVDFSGVVKKLRNSLTTDKIGSADSAVAFLKAVGSAKKASFDDIYKVLSSKSSKKILPQLIDVLGAAQTNSTHQAALKVLNLRNTENIELAERYLWALSMSPNVQNWIIEELIALMETEHNDEKLWQTLVLTLPAMTTKYTVLHGNNELMDKTMVYLTRKLNECKEDSCQLIYLRGFLNFPNDRALPLLLEKSVTSKNRAGVIAIEGIRRMGPSAWGSEVIDAALRIFLANDTYDSSARTIACDILLGSNLSDSTLAKILSLLKLDDSPRELKEYLLQRLSEEFEKDSTFKKRVKNVLTQNGMYNYEVLAQGGLSTAFSRSFMPGGSLSTTQEVLNGLLKRGNVHINLERNGGTETVFTLGLFSSGLGTFMGGSNDSEEATAGLELTVLNVALRPFVFFTGHGELMSQVWSGAASELTPAYQALVLLEDVSEELQLNNGFSFAIRYYVSASVDLSGQIIVSIWNRNAESLVQNRAGLAFLGSMELDTSFFQMETEFSSFVEPELHLTSAIDFSDKIALCLQLQQPDSASKFQTRFIQRLPGTKYRLSKTKNVTVSIPGKTYALNSKNNEMCNLLLGEEEEEEEQTGSD